MMRSKKELAVTLSKLAVCEKPSWRLEQYPTDSEIAAEILWFAQQTGDLEGSVADLGCGTGILGIGALLLDAKKVYFVDMDERILRRLRENLQLFEFDNYEIVNSDVSAFSTKVDTVIQNPPFGVKRRHADTTFLEQAFTIAEVIYSFHKLSTKEYIYETAKTNNFKPTHIFKFDFPLKNTQKYHKKRLERIKVGCWRLLRQ